MSKKKVKCVNYQSTNEEDSLWKDTHAEILALDSLLISGHEKGQVACIPRNNKKDTIDLALKVLLNVLIVQKKSVGFFGSKFTNGQIVEKLLLMHTGISKEDFSRKEVICEKWEKILAFSQYLETADLYLYSDEHLDLVKILPTTDSLAMKGKLDFLIIHIADHIDDTPFLKILQITAESLNIDIVVAVYESNTSEK